MRGPVAPPQKKAWLQPIGQPVCQQDLGFLQQLVVRNQIGLFCRLAHGMRTAGEACARVLGQAHEDKRGAGGNRGDDEEGKREIGCQDFVAVAAKPLRLQYQRANSDSGRH